MKIPIEWLKEYVKTDLSAEDIGAQLTSLGHMQDGPVQQIAGDHVLDLEVRQNRPDALSIVGVARELSAVTKKDLLFPELHKDLGASNNITNVTIEDNDLCYRFHAITIEGIALKESPDWLKKRLERYGIKTINNIVDITNYVATELGMPLHAYDANAVANRSITIRAAKKGESLTLLGGKKVELVTDDLIHADSTGPIGFGGLMGGEAKGVHEKTTAIILEAAVYNQASIRRSSLRHAIRTESSTRHEKFLHPSHVDIALQRAIKLIFALAGGEAVTIVDNTDAYPHPEEQKKITFPLSEISRLGGVEIDNDTVEDILRRLEISVVEKKADTLTVQPPYFRTDLEGEADLVEEVVRLYGYDNIPTTPLASPTPKNIQSRLFEFEEQVKDLMTGAGYDEQITEPLTDEASPARPPILLQNSLTAEKRMLRTTLKHTLHRAVGERKKYRHSSIRLFEVGKIYYMKGDDFKEQASLGVILHDENVSFSDAKGVVELLFERLERTHDASLYTIENISGEKIPTFYIEINLEGLFAASKAKRSIVYTTPPQVILHDFSFVVMRDVKVGDILEYVRGLSPLITAVELGELPKETSSDMKSVFIHVTYGDSKSTLSEEAVSPVRQTIIEGLQKTFSAKFK